MAGPGRRRVEVPGRIFRLAVRDLRAAAAAPENLAPEEAMPLPPPPPPPPVPRLDSSGRSRETADTQERSSKNLEVTSKKRPADSIGDEGKTGKKRLYDSVLAAAETSKKRPAVSIGAEAGTSRKKPSQGSRLSADTFSTFEELEATNTSAGRPKSFKKVDTTTETEWSWREREELEKQSHYKRLQEQGKTEQTRKDLAAGTSGGHPSGGHPKIFKEKHKGTSGPTEIDNPNPVQQKKMKAKDDDELVNTDASQKAKNDIATLDFLAELEANYSLDIIRQRFAHANNLPIPPPSWDRVATPPIPSSPPPPIFEIGNCEEAKNALKAWRQGRCMHLLVSEELSLSDAENISAMVKDAHAERVVLNPSILEAKASQAKHLQQMISHTVGELQLYNQMLALPWMPTQTVSGSNLL